jgi:cell division transport system ATP-binding protein
MDGWEDHSAMIDLRSVSKQYDSTKALNLVNLELKRGEFIYLVGGSGAGKSTLLRMLATEEAPSDGTISLFGYNLGSVSQGTLRTIRRALGYVPQNVKLIPDLSVYDNIALSVKLAGRGSVSQEIKARIHDLLERLGIGAKHAALAERLSGGESQRVAVARALVRSPELIIADEPTGAQDHDHTWAMMDLLVKANLAGATVVVATHDREIVRRVRKRCAVLKSGILSLEGPNVCI